MMALADKVLESVLGRGDLGHLALLLWALAETGLAIFMLRELMAANRRFDDFVRELARFNSRHEGGQP
jgi:hypothetical protein